VSSPCYSREELAGLGLASFGPDVHISRKASLYNPEAIALGNHVRIDDFTVLSGGSGITMGDYVHVACFTALYGAAGITIGSHATLSSRCAIYSVSDDYSGESLTNPTVPESWKPGLRAKPVKLGDHVIVGTNSTILPGVTLGEGAALGAHTLANKDCDPWTIYVGSPARILRARSQLAKTLAEEFAAQQGLLSHPA
jgi:dTDP-4-amino-4,6-dideoxy-D-glucose acyltransferase